MAAAEGDAKVLARGVKVDDRPVTVVASTPAYKPSRLALDVTSGGAPVRVEWIVLCYDSLGPTTGGEIVAARSVNLRIELPPRPRGICYFEAEATLVEGNRPGQIDLTLRGQVRKPPAELPLR